MNRLKLLTMATLMAVTFTACDEGTPPPVDPPPPPDPVGTISGTVTIDGEGAAGITATLSSGTTTTTNTSGAFTFADVVAGSYTVSISGFADDVTFPSASQSATIASDGQTVNLNFAGQYIRSSSVVGAVVASDPMMSGSSDGQPETLAGVTVKLSGEHVMGEMGEMSVTQETNMETGGYAFTGLRAGTYTVEISGYPEDVKFEELSMTLEVGVGEVGNANFEGAYIRTAAIEGRVIIEGEGLPGVMVTLVGGPADDSYTKMTGADGEYAFTELRPGTYQVDISGYDPRDYEFAATSQEVSVGLDETETVSFTGELLRTAGISGRVSVEGMGLEGIAVTLSGAADDSTMTDASGQYAFAGLAAGDYTVTIAVESDAYVFDAMSSDVTVADEESAIVNFEGAHATTASVSGMLFIDELDKNDMMDAGEHPLPAPGVPVALVGPGVNDQRLGATGPDGTFMFAGLRAGPYQLVVPIDAGVAAALAENDLAYGGPGVGYAFDLAVGEAKSQAIPFDITHTTINVAVTLKGTLNDVEHRGMPIPGASVTLYADEDGETKVGSGETEASAAGVYTSIRVARAGTSDNTVYMGVDTDYFEDPTAEMQAVTWNPQSFVHPAADANPPAVLNDADIVNLSVDVSVSGATVTTDYGGGDALAGWAIVVLSGDPTDPTSLMPVEGAPAMLGEEDADDEGMASFETTVMPTDLPATYVFGLAPDQDDEMDGGENYAAAPVVYTHTGLSLAGTQDAGALVASYTTQTLKVYVHHELDQVVGFTGNVLGGDEMDDGKVSVELRYIDDNGRSRPFQNADSIDYVEEGDDGAWVFSNVPADKKVIVKAEDGQDDDDEGYQAIIVLDDGEHSDELAAYRDTYANGITGGHFGAMGGYSHTVELCPLQKTNPQDHDECSSFAYVSAHTVSGLIWKRSVEMDDADDFEAVEDPDFEPGLTFGLTPDEDKNLAGEEQTVTTAEEDDDDTEDLDETHMFEFADIAAGAYELDLPVGWRARIPATDDDLGDVSPKGATGMVGNALNPLGGPVSLDITPSTATVYGFVVDEDGFAMDDATVTANAESTTTDEHGRFIIEGILGETHEVDGEDEPNKVLVEAKVEGIGAASVILDFVANSVTEVKKDGDDLTLSAAAETASITGKVSASGSAAPIAGATVEVSYDGGDTFEAPENTNAEDDDENDIYVTGTEGDYTVMVKAQERGDGVSVRVTKEGMSFIPDQIDDIPAHSGSDVSGFDFTGFVNARITGRVVAAGGGPMSGVVVTATEAGVADATPTATDTTGRTGTFVLSVPYDRYTIEATAPETSLTRFSYPDDERDVRVAPGQSVSFGNITGASVNARSISATRVKDETTGAYSGAVDISWRFDNVDGFTAPAHQIETCVTEACVEADWTDAGFSAQTGDDTEDSADDGIRVGTFDAPASNEGDLSLRVRITVTSDETLADGGTANREGTSAVRTVGRVDSSPEDITAVRDTDDDATADSLIINWEASTNTRTATRVVITVDIDGLGEQSLIATGGTQFQMEVDGATVTDATSRVYVVNDGNTGITAADWTIVGTAVTVNVTEEILRKALDVRVETRQAEEVDADDEEVWHATDTKTVDADPAEDGNGG